MDNKRPFARLSPDVLTGVFTFCLPDRPSFRRSDAPMLLTHVCRTWRNVALDYRPLWSQIEVPDLQNLPKGIVKLLKLWLLRAGNNLVDVYINIGYLELSRIHGQKMDRFKETLRMLSLYSDRVRTLNASFPPPYLELAGIEDMMNLTSIKFVGEGRGCGLPEFMLDIGPQKDALEQFTVGDCNVNLDSLVVQTQLKYLTLYPRSADIAVSESVAFELLASLPALGVVSLRVAADPLPSLPNGRIKLPNLKDFTLNAYRQEDSIITVLGRICTPNLQALQLPGHASLDDDSDWNILHSFMMASQAPIKRLSLDDFELTSSLPLAIDCLAICNEIRHLSLNEREYVGDVFIRALTACERSQCLPNMEHLKFALCEGFSRPALVSFMESRTTKAPPGFSQLRDVTIYCSEAEKDEVYTLIEPCGVEKLKLWRYYPTIDTSSYWI